MQLIPLIYLLICIICPITYSHFSNFKLFGNEFDSSWFTRDFTYILGLILIPFINFIKKEEIRKKVSYIFILVGFFQLFNLLYSDNNYSLMTTIIGCVLLFISILYIYNGDN